MHTAAALIDLHERTQRSFQGLLDHCAGMAAEELDRELEGFGYATIRLQLQHMISAEQYWVGVLRGEMLVEEDALDAASIEALQGFRRRVAEATRVYLTDVSDAQLNARCQRATWGGKQVQLVPAHVVLRTQTHIFQHQGQITAMARLLGRPAPAGLDFPLT